MSTATPFMTKPTKTPPSMTPSGSQLSDQLSDDDRRLGRALYDAGVLDDAGLEQVLAAQREHGEPLRTAAVRLGLASERDIRKVLDKQGASAAQPEVIVERHLEAVRWPEGARAEAMRSLRSELTLRWFNQRHDILAVGEVRKGDGAAALAADLACSLAQLDRRILLIDANLREPQLQSFFGARTDCGLAECLRGICTWRNALYTVPGLNSLHVMFAGEAVPNAQELLCRSAFGFLLEAVSDAFDGVLIITSPMLETADMQAVAARAGGCLVTARRHHTRLADLERVSSYLAPTTASLVGWVLEG